MNVGLALASGTLLRIISKNLVLISVVYKKLFFLSRLEFDQAQVRGPGLWKFNASLLKDNEFCAIIEDRISYLSSCIDYFPSVKSWWDFFKTSLKSEMVFFSRIRRRCLSRERVFLVKRFS